MHSTMFRLFVHLSVHPSACVAFTFGLLWTMLLQTCPCEYVLLTSGRLASLPAHHHSHREGGRRRSIMRHRATWAPQRVSDSEPCRGNFAQFFLTYTQKQTFCNAQSCFWYSENSLYGFHNRFHLTSDQQRQNLSLCVSLPTRYFLVFW